MPDLEQRIKDGLDHLGERPDPARILEQVGRRKRHLRLMHRVQTVTLVVVVLAGVGGGMYALTRAFGFGASRPLPGNTSVPSVPRITPCSGDSAVVTASPLGGAAGTISTLWRVTNTAATPCRARGYPGMDFHTSSGWLSVKIHRGGFPNINQPPKSIVVPAGQSLYFVSYWNDAPTDAGPCQQFDRARVTLPDNGVSVEVAASGCLNPLTVDVGPVTGTPPS
jgi:hypothetical protein